jgi:DNA-binding NtrC family response regulator
LQEHEVTRVGGVKPIHLDVRVIAATNSDLERMVKKGTFRKDLYYRLNVVSIEIPPLRERREDIPRLVKHFADIFCEKHKIQKEFMEETVNRMMEYEWPGNIRELQNVVENLVIMTNTVKIGPESLSARLRKPTIPGQSFFMADNEIVPLKEALQNTERLLISMAMEKYKSTRIAARALGVDQSTVVRKLHSIKQK